MKTRRRPLDFSARIDVHSRRSTGNRIRAGGFFRLVDEDAERVFFLRDVRAYHRWVFTQTHGEDLLGGNLALIDCGLDAVEFKGTWSAPGRPKNNHARLMFRRQGHDFAADFSLAFEVDFFHIKTRGGSSHACIRDKKAQRERRDGVNRRRGQRKIEDTIEMFQAAFAAFGRRPSWVHTFRETSQRSSFTAISAALSFILGSPEDWTY